MYDFPIVSSRKVYVTLHQTGRFLMYFFISIFALYRVLQLVIAVGALIHSLVASLMKVSKARFDVPNSVKVPLVIDLNARPPSGVSFFFTLM